MYEFRSTREVASMMYFKIPLWQRPGLTVKNLI